MKKKESLDRYQIAYIYSLDGADKIICLKDMARTEDTHWRDQPHTHGEKCELQDPKLRKQFSVITSSEESDLERTKAIQLLPIPLLCFPQNHINK